MPECVVLGLARLVACYVRAATGLPRGTPSVRASRGVHEILVCRVFKNREKQKKEWQECRSHFIGPHSAHLFKRYWLQKPHPKDV